MEVPMGCTAAQSVYGIQREFCNELRKHLEGYNIDVISTFAGRVIAQAPSMRDPNEVESAKELLVMLRAIRTSLSDRIAQCNIFSDNVGSNNIDSTLSIAAQLSGVLEQTPAQGYCYLFIASKAMLRERTLT